MAPRRIVQEQVVCRDQVEALERRGDAAGVGERRDHVGAEEQEHAHPAVLERLRDPRHLVRHVVAGRAPFARRDAGETLSVRGGAVARSQSGTRDAEVAGEGRQTRDGAGALPALGALVHGAAADEDHRRFRRRVAAREGGDLPGVQAGRCRCPGEVVSGEMGGERIEADCMAGDECRIMEPLRDDHVHHPECQGGVRPGPQQDRFVRLRRGLGAPHVDGDDVGAAPFRRRQVPPGVRLAREIRAPEQDQRRVGPHVLLGACLEHARQTEPESAEAPADHVRVPPLAPVQIRESPEQLGGEPRAVVVGEEPVPGPGADGPWPHGPRPLGDGVERVLPGRPLPRPASR